MGINILLQERMGMLLYTIMGMGSNKLFPHISTPNCAKIFAITF